MRNLALALAGTALASVVFVSAAPADAQFRGLRSAVQSVKNAADEVEDAAEDVEEAARTVEGVASGVDAARRSDGRSVVGAVTGGRGAAVNQAMRQRSNYPQTARAPDHVGRAGPAPARYVNQISCANLKVGDAFVAEAGEYTFSQGISTQTRGGLINRAPVNPSNGCFFPGLGVGDVLYVEVDKAAYERGTYRIQCVSYDGSEQLDNVDGARQGNYTGKDVMLHTGHSLGYTPTATGSNSDRSGAYDRYLNQRGRKMLTFNFSANHQDKSGTDFFCQWYDRDTNKSAVAFTYRRGPQG
ncbi:MAG: hypothetical protein ACX930_06805 [Erythrobacter sp.]